jgi:hypothetical protein
VQWSEYLNPVGTLRVRMARRHRAAVCDHRLRRHEELAGPGGHRARHMDAARLDALRRGETKTRAPGFAPGAPAGLCCGLLAPPCRAQSHLAATRLSLRCKYPGVTGRHPRATLNVAPDRGSVKGKTSGSKADDAALQQCVDSRLERGKENAMRRYEFLCEKCQKPFEFIMTIWERVKPTCFTCKGTNVTPQFSGLMARTGKKS